MAIDSRLPERSEGSAVLSPKEHNLSGARSRRAKRLDSRLRLASFASKKIWSFRAAMLLTWKHAKAWTRIFADRTRISADTPLRWVRGYWPPRSKWRSAKIRAPSAGIRVPGFSGLWMHRSTWTAEPATTTGTAD